MIQQTLNLITNQQLQLTPKLQQAIRMLQLSSQELSQELIKALETNVMLELDGQLDDIITPLSQLTETEFNHSFENSDNSKTELSETIFESSAQFNENSSSNPQHWRHQPDSLQDYLLWQLRASQFSMAEYPIGEMIISAINEEGFLTESLTEIQKSLLRHHKPVSRAQIQQVLTKIQRFDPPGVGAKDLAQALLLQLATYPKHTPYLDIAKHIIREHLPLLAEHHYVQLARSCKIKSAELNQAILLIQGLNPRPGNAFLLKDSSDYIIPDIIVIKKGTTWQVKLNALLLPKLRLNQPYLSLLAECPRGANSQFIQTHLREAKWLIQCVRQRNETLLNVAACIIKHQQAFMTHGPGAIKALILKDIATELNLHQSTVSRVSTKKYIQTPQGTFELKYFFSSHVNTTYGQQCSALAIQSFIKEMISQEDRSHPLSDHKLADQLALKGLTVARRTIHKYRELLHIPMAAKRKRMHQLS